MHARVLIAESRLVACGVGGIELVEPNELHHGRDAIHGNDSDVTRRIVRDSTPMCAAHVRRHRQCPLKAWWRINAVVSKQPDLCETRVAVGGCESPHVVHCEPLRAEWGNHRVEGLGRRRALSVHRACRHRSLFHGKEWLTRFPVEHEKLAGLGRLKHRSASASATHEFHERRRRRHVVVPEIVMHDLKVPDDLSR